MKQFAVYTLARFAVFGVCLALAFGFFWLLALARGGGAEDIPVLWAVLLGAVLSVTVSAWLLRDLREELAAGVQARAERMVSSAEDGER